MIIVENRKDHLTTIDGTRTDQLRNFIQLGTQKKPLPISFFKTLDSVTLGSLYEFVPNAIGFVASENVGTPNTIKHEGYASSHQVWFVSKAIICVVFCESATEIGVYTDGSVIKPNSAIFTPLLTSLSDVQSIIKIPIADYMYVGRYIVFKANLSRIPGSRAKKCILHNGEPIAYSAIPEGTALSRVTPRSYGALFANMCAVNAGHEVGVLTDDKMICSYGFKDAIEKARVAIATSAVPNLSFSRVYPFPNSEAEAKSLSLAPLMPVRDVVPASTNAVMARKWALLLKDFPEGAVIESLDVFSTSALRDLKEQLIEDGFLEPSVANDELLAFLRDQMAYEKLFREQIYFPYALYADSSASSVADFCNHHALERASYLVPMSEALSVLLAEYAEYKDKKLAEAVDTLNRKILDMIEDFTEMVLDAGASDGLEGVSGLWVGNAMPTGYDMNELNPPDHIRVVTWYIPVTDEGLMRLCFTRPHTQTLFDKLASHLSAESQREIANIRATHFHIINRVGVSDRSSISLAFEDIRGADLKEGREALLTHPRFLGEVSVENVKPFASQGHVADVFGTWKDIPGFRAMPLDVSVIPYVRAPKYDSFLLQGEALRLTKEGDKVYWKGSTRDSFSKLLYLLEKDKGWTYTYEDSLRLHRDSPSYVALADRCVALGGLSGFVDGIIGVTMNGIVHKYLEWLQGNQLLQDDWSCGSCDTTGHCSWSGTYHRWSWTHKQHEWYERFLGDRGDKMSTTRELVMPSLRGQLSPHKNSTCCTFSTNNSYQGFKKGKPVEGDLSYYSGSVLNSGKLYWINNIDASQVRCELVDGEPRPKGVLSFDITIDPFLWIDRDNYNPVTSWAAVQVRNVFQRCLDEAAKFFIGDSRGKALAGAHFKGYCDENLFTLPNASDNWFMDHDYLVEKGHGRHHGKHRYTKMSSFTYMVTVPLDFFSFTDSAFTFVDRLFLDKANEEFGEGLASSSALTVADSYRDYIRDELLKGVDIDAGTFLAERLYTILGDTCEFGFEDPSGETILPKESAALVYSAQRLTGVLDGIVTNLRKGDKLLVDPLYYSFVNKLIAETEWLAKQPVKPLCIVTRNTLVEAMNLSVNDSRFTDHYLNYL